MNTRWGIDMGGTKIEGIVLNSDDHQVIARLRVPTEGHLGYEHVLGQVEKLIDSLKLATGLTTDTLGIGMPGTMDPILNVMKNCNTTALNGKNLKSDLESKLGLSCRLSNDANCFAIAEARMGSIPAVMPEANVVFGVIMGTGVGGGLVINGQVIGGRQGIGGEWGHNFLDSSGGLCYCSQTGCVETILAGPSLERYYHAKSGIKKPLKNIVIAYRNGSDPYAEATMNRLFEYFGRAMSVVINIVDPDAIVIGGGVGNIDEIYTLGVEEVKKHVFNHRLDTVFLKPLLGDSAGVFGAAFL